MVHRCSIRQCIAVKHQRRLSSATLCRGRIGGKQLYRLCCAGGTCCASGTSGACRASGTCCSRDTGNASRTSGAARTSRAGGAARTSRAGGAARTSRAGGAGCSARTSRASRAGRGDDKRKVAINPQTMGNYKKIKSITLRMEPSGTTWAAFLRGQAGKEEIY